jgi:hypothetical protein
VPSWPFWPRARGSDGTLVASATVAEREPAVAPPGLPEMGPPKASPPDAPDGPLRWYQRRGTILAALALTVLGALALVIVGSAHRSSLVPPAKGGFGLWMVGPFRGAAGGLTRDHDTLAALFSVLILLMAGCYALLVAAGRHVPLRWVVGAIVATHIVLVLGPPLLLTDIFNYLDYARMGTLHGLNPFTAVPGDAGGDPTYHYATWHHLSSPYGPLFTLFTYLLVPLDFKPSYWTLKLLLMAASLGSLYLVWRTALRLRRPAVPALVFVAFNPLLLVFGLGGFHNDFLIMLAVLGGILLLLNGRPAGGAVAMVAAAGMKATAVVILPFAVIGSSDRRRALLGAIVTGAALVVASVAVFGTVVPSLGPQTTLVSPLGALNLLGLALGFGGATTGMQVIAPVVLVAVIGYLLWKTWHGADWMDMAGWAVFALLLSLSWVVPWYVMWLLPLAALSASRSLKRATLAVTALLFVTSLPATALLLANQVGWYPDHTKLGKQHADEIQRYLK